MDLLDIYQFIASDNPLAAIEFIRRLKQVCHDLEDMPEGGSAARGFCPGRANSGFRAACDDRLPDREGSGAGVETVLCRPKYAFGLR